MEAPQRNDKSGTGSQVEEVLARLVCRATEIYPEAEGEDLRHCTKDFALCLSADGLLRTDEASTNLPWYPLEGNTRTALRTDEGGWRGVCSSHGHVTLLARGSLPKSQAQAQVHQAAIQPQQPPAEPFAIEKESPAKNFSRGRTGSLLSQNLEASLATASSSSNSERCPHLTS